MAKMQTCANAQSPGKPSPCQRFRPWIWAGVDVLKTTTTWANMSNSLSNNVYLYCIYPPSNLATYLPIYLSTYLPIYLSIYLSTYLPIFPSTHLPTYLPTYLSIYLSTYLHIAYKYMISCQYGWLWLTICVHRIYIELTHFIHGTVHISWYILSILYLLLKHAMLIFGSKVNHKISQSDWATPQLYILPFCRSTSTFKWLVL